MIELTDSAADAIRSAMSSAAEPVAGLRLMVQTGGCAGYQYMMGLVARGEAQDVVVTHHDINVYIDEQSASLLRGTRVDFTIGLQGSGFTFSNPNAENSCSCGKSFG